MKQDYLENIIKDHIHSLTCYNIKDIELISSSKTNSNLRDFDCHEFKYQNKIYILKKDKLILKNTK